MDFQSLLMLDDESYRRFVETSVILLTMGVVSMLATVAAYAKGRADAARDLAKVVGAIKVGDSGFVDMSRPEDKRSIGVGVDD